MHTRVDYLSLDDVDGYELGTNNIWDTLTDLNKLNRQTFKPFNAHRKLQLILPQAEDEQGGEDEEGLGLGEEYDHNINCSTIMDSPTLLSEFSEPSSLSKSILTVQVAAAI